MLTAARRAVQRQLRVVVIAVVLLLAYVLIRLGVSGVARLLGAG